jgi:hypothetical protein
MISKQTNKQTKQKNTTITYNIIGAIGSFVRNWKSPTHYPNFSEMA